MSEELKVTLVQTELIWEDAEGNIQQFGEKLQRVSDTDLVVLPEMFTTGFTMNPQSLSETMDGKTVTWMQVTAQTQKFVLCGSVIIEESGHFFNRFIAAYPDGSLKTYDKKHLFGLAGEDKPYQAGTDRLVMEIKGWIILPLICYDLRFPVWARSQKSENIPWEYDVLLYVANWPKPRVKAWDTLLQARAIENQAYCVGVNRIGLDGNQVEYNGHSAVYDYGGEPMLIPTEDDCLRTAVLSKTDLHNFREKLPFQKDADGFELL